MTTLEDTIKQYEDRAKRIRRKADERIDAINKHVEKLKKRLEQKRK